MAIEHKCSAHTLDLIRLLIASGHDVEALIKIAGSAFGDGVLAGWDACANGDRRPDDNRDED